MSETEQQSTSLQFHSMKTTPQARGKRVESMRKMMRLSRRAFWERYGIPPTSLQNWEDAKGNGLTEKGARKIITLVKPDGILCTFEWLMYGIGPGPQLTEKFFSEEDSAFSNNASEVNHSIVEETEEVVIMRELLVFHKNFPKKAIDLVVKDDGMEPRFIVGEYVAGCKHHGEAMTRLIGLDCIVQTADGDVLLRNLKKVNCEDKFTLACTNPHTTVDKPILYEVELFSAAPVIWARRKHPKIG